MSLRVAPPPLEARGRSPGALWFRHGGFSCTAETLRRANARRLSGGSSPRSCRRFTSRRPWLQKKHGLGNRSYRSAATGAAPSALSSPCNTLRCSRTHTFGSPATTRSARAARACQERHCGARKGWQRQVLWSSCSNPSITCRSASYRLRLAQPLGRAQIAPRLGLRFGLAPRATTR